MASPEPYEDASFTAALLHQIVDAASSPVPHGTSAFIDWDLAESCMPESQHSSAQVVPSTPADLTCDTSAALAWQPDDTVLPPPSLPTPPMSMAGGRSPAPPQSNREDSESLGEVQELSDGYQALADTVEASPSVIPSSRRPVGRRSNVKNGYVVDHYSGEIPDGYVLVPKGNNRLTNTCRAKALAAGTVVFLLARSGQERDGILIRKDIHDKVVEMISLDVAKKSSSRNREKIPADERPLKKAGTNGPPQPYTRSETSNPKFPFHLATQSRLKRSRSEMTEPARPPPYLRSASDPSGGFYSFAQGINSPIDSLFDALDGPTTYDDESNFDNESVADSLPSASGSNEPLATSFCHELSGACDLGGPLDAPHNYEVLESLSALGLLQDRTRAPPAATCHCHSACDTPPLDIEVPSAAAARYDSTRTTLQALMSYADDASVPLERPPAAAVEHSPAFAAFDLDVAVVQSPAASDFSDCAGADERLQELLPPPGLPASSEANVRRSVDDCVGDELLQWGYSATEVLRILAGTGAGAKPLAARRKRGPPAGLAEAHALLPPLYPDGVPTTAAAAAAAEPSSASPSAAAGFGQGFAFGDIPLRRVPRNFALGLAGRAARARAAAASAGVSAAAGAAPGDVGDETAASAERVVRRRRASGVGGLVGYLAGVEVEAAVPDALVGSPPVEAVTMAEQHQLPARRLRSGRQRPNHKPHVTAVLFQWLMENRHDPYPGDADKKQLAARTELTLNQVNDWFINARRRYL
ncbi:Homeobox protein pknox1 [Cladochytrium tenue]|nr:Homeobox protein pknox1 [Cladochytrium tenue]